MGNLRMKVLPCAGRRLDLDAAAQPIDSISYDIQAYSTASLLGHRLGRRHARPEDQIDRFTVAKRGRPFDQAARNGRLAQSLRVDARAIVAHRDGNLIALIRRGDEQATEREACPRVRARRGARCHD